MSKSSSRTSKISNNSRSTTSDIVQNPLNFCLVLKAIRRNRILDLNEIFDEEMPYEYLSYVTSNGLSLLDVAAKYGRLTLFKTFVEFDFEITPDTFKIAYLYRRKRILSEIINTKQLDLGTFFKIALRNPLKCNRKYLSNNNDAVQSCPKGIYILLIRKALEIGNKCVALKLIKISGVENNIVQFQNHFKYRPGGPGYRKSQQNFYNNT